MKNIMQSLNKVCASMPGKNLWLAILAMLLLVSAATAAEITKTDDANPLDQDTSWVGGTAPGPADVALFDNTIISGAISPNIGAAASWQGIKVTNPGGLITIGSLTAANSLTLGLSGIDMSSASQNLTISGAAISLRIADDQTWNVGSGGGALTLTTVTIPWVGNTLNGAYPRGVVDFTGAGTISVANLTTVQPGILGGWATFNGTNWATKSGSVVVPFTAYTVPADPAGGTTTLSGTAASSTSFDFAGDYTWSLANNLRATRVTATGAVNINTTAGSSTAITANSILMTEGAGPVTINPGLTPAAARMLVGAAGGLPFNVIQNSTNDLAINIKMNPVTGTPNNMNPLVKSGPGRVILSNPNTNLRSTNNYPFAIINDGILAISTADGISTVNNVLGLYPPVPIAGSMVLNGGTFQTLASTTIAVNRGWTVGRNGGGLQVDGTFVTLNIDGVIDSAVANTGDLTISESAASSGGIISLNAANTYSGNTIISSGTLALGASGSIASTPKITVNSNATFDVSAPGGFTFASGQTLAGGSASGTASVNGTLTLGSGATATFKADGSGSTVGKISVTGDLTLSGNVITVDVTGSALPSGTYTLMDCTGTLSGAPNATPVITGLGTAGGAAAFVNVVGSAVVLDVAFLGPPPVGLYFSQQPTDAGPAATITPAVSVTVTNADGSGWSNGPVTLSLIAGGGTLNGTLTRLTDVNGVATFNNLSIGLAGAKQLRATNAFGGIFADSASFNILAGPATQLAINMQPSASASAGVAFAQQPVIYILDAGGNLTTANLTVTVEQNVGGTLQGTTSIAAVNGVATFSGLNATNAGTIKLNFASAGLTGASSDDIIVGPGAAAMLGITTAIGTNQFDRAAFAPSPVVRLLDAFGNLSESTADVAANLASSTGGALDGTLGTTNVTAVSGTATFANLIFNLLAPQVGETNVEIYFTSAGLPSVTNGLIIVNPTVNITFASPPGPTTAGLQQSVIVNVLDGSGAPYTDTPVTLSKLSGTGALYGTTNLVTDAYGNATSTDIQFNEAGDKRITATALGRSVNSVIFNIAPAAYSQLLVLAPGETRAPDTVSGKTGTPTGHYSFSPFNMTVNAVDAFFNITLDGPTVDVTTSDASDTNPGSTNLVNGTVAIPVAPGEVTNALTVTAIDAGSSLTNTSSAIPILFAPLYASQQNGYWNDYTTWLVDTNGGGYVPAVAGQTPNNLIGAILVTHTVTVTNAVTVDQVTVGASGTVVVTNVTLTIANGPGTDMSVSGILKCQGSLGFVTANGTLVFTSTGTYDHNRDAGTTPTATWGVGSTFALTGFTSEAPINSWQDLYHFICDAPNISSATRSFRGRFTNILGNATFTNMNNPVRLLSDNPSLNFHVAGNLTVYSKGISGGYTSYGGYIRVGGNVSLLAANALADDISGVVLEFGGDGSAEQIFTSVPGGINAAGDYSVLIRDNAKVKLASDLSIGGSGSTAVTVGQNARLDTGTNAIPSGAFTANSGATLITANANGGLTTTNLVSFGSVADVIFNGTVAQTSGVVLSGSPNNVTNLGTVGLTLTGTGSVVGNLAGGTRLEGTGTNNITVGKLILPGTTVMKINAAGSPTSDLFTFTTLSATGSLVVTNTGGAIPLSTTFTLFSAGAPFGGGVTLPGAPYYQWQNDLATLGSITLTNIVPPAAETLNVSQSGDVLTFTWTNTIFKLQCQTNTLDTGLSINWFDYPDGTNGVSVTIDPESPTVFFRLIDTL